MLLQSTTAGCIKDCIKDCIMYRAWVIVQLRDAIRMGHRATLALTAKMAVAVVAATATMAAAMTATVTVTMIAGVAASGCNDSEINDDGHDAGVDPDAVAEDAGPKDAGTDPDGATETDGGASALVEIATFELEVGVNVDDPAGEGLLRWYGGFYPAIQGGTVTGVTVDTLELTENGTLRVTTAPALQSQSALGQLPAVQEQVWGVVTLSAEELTTCQNSGPELHRGNWGQGELRVRLCGASDQGTWCDEEVIDGEVLFRTCHGGVSYLARGWVDVWENNQPPPPTYIDLGANVYVRDPFAYDPVEFTTLVVHGEGVTETYVIPETATGSPCYGTTPECFNLLYQTEGTVGEILCPGPNSPNFPPELYLTYEGTAAGQPFSGTAPADQCMLFTQHP
jgi:hypothetical protein